MRAFLAFSLNVPAWLVLALLMSVAAQNHFLYTHAVQAWREKDLAQANSRSCDDYLQPGVKYSNLSDSQKTHYDKCHSHPTTTKEKP